MGGQAAYLSFSAQEPAAGAGDKKRVTTKEVPEHSLPYLLAVALLDGEMTPAQYSEERLRRRDVQELLQRVGVHEDRELSAAFPERWRRARTSRGHPGERAPW